MERIKCALCGSEEYDTILQAEDYRFHTTNKKFNLVCCRRCGLVYLNPRPKREEFDKFYRRLFYAKQNRMSKFAVKLLHYIKIQEIIRFKKNGRILDVGCGSGGLLFNFKERGWETYGVDTSENACRLAKKTLRRNVYNCTLNDCFFPSRHFDVAILNHVIEHMSQPSKELIEVHRVLKSNGVLFLYTPNIDSYQFKVTKDKWLHLDVPRHLFFYSSNTITALLENVGFEVVSVKYPLFDFPLDLYYGLKVKFALRHNLLVAVISPFLVTISFLVKLLPTWRGSMLIVAVKKSSKKYS